MQRNNRKNPGNALPADDQAPKGINKPLVIGVIVAVVLITLASVLPVAYKAFMTPGIKTDGVVTDGAVAASTDINGDWKVIHAARNNPTSVGYTFNEILPGERRTTSGSTGEVTGDLKVEGNELKSANVTVDMTTIKTEVEKRDINVRRSLLHTDQYPTATFVATGTAKLDGIPSDGSVGKASVPGTLTIHGVSKEVTADFDILRTGDQLVASTAIPINRLDYGVETHDFVAAKIDEQGELNIRVAFEK